MGVCGGCGCVLACVLVCVCACVRVLDAFVQDKVLVRTLCVYFFVVCLGSRDGD